MSTVHSHHLDGSSMDDAVTLISCAITDDVPDRVLLRAEVIRTLGNEGPRIVAAVEALAAFAACYLEIAAGVAEKDPHDLLSQFAIADRLVNPR